MDEAHKELVLKFKLCGRGMGVRDPEKYIGGVTVADCIRIADALEALAGEVERLTLNGIHTCHDQCQRLPCVQGREIRALTAERDRLKAALEAMTADRDHLAGEVERLTSDVDALGENLEKAIARAEAAEAERDELANWKASFLHENEQILASNAQLAAERDRLKAALEDIGKQPLITEMGDDDLDGAIEEGYDQCILTARKALGDAS